MPALIPAIAYFGTVGTIGAIGATFVATAASLVVGDVQQRRAAQKARDAFNRSLQDRTVMTSLADGVRSRIYGEARNVDGVLYKAAHGTDNRYYSLILAICDAPTAIESVQAVYFNDVPVTLDGSGWVQTAPWAITERVSTSQDITLSGGAGNVTLSHTPISGTVTGSWTTGVGDSQASGTVTVSLVGLVASVSGLSSSITTVQVSYQYDAVRTYARVRTYLGGAAQDLHTDFADLPDITSTDKFAGIAVARVDLEYSQDAFPAGLPQISFVVRGTKCLDPRTSTTAWTRNPAIIARDWSLFAYGGGITSAAYNDTYGNASANACDVDATFTTGGTPVVMDTYQAGIVCRLDASPQQWLEAMVEAMAGRWGWAGGKLCLQAGTYRSPATTITEDWVTDRGAINATKDIPVADMANGYRPTIANRDNGYVVEPMPELAPSAYVSADGQKLLREVTFEAVTSRQHALHVAGVLLRDQRQSLQIELPCNYRAFALELFDVVNVTLPFFGFSAKPFEVLGWAYSLDRGVVLQLKEIASSIYTVDAAFTGLENEDNTNLPDPSVVEQIAGLAVASDYTFKDGGNAGRVRVSWTAVADINVLQSGWVEVQHLRLGLLSGDPGYGQWVPTLERGERTATYISGLKPGGVYLFRARAINTIGARGKWSSQVMFTLPEAVVDTGIVLVPHGTGSAGMLVVGSSASKGSGTAAWDAGVHSKAAIIGGCEAAAVLVETNTQRMLALNSDPTTDGSYTSLDYAIYAAGSGVLEIYESGSLVLGSLSYAANDRVSIRYTGASIEYRKNSTLLRVVKAPISLALSLDSSFNTVGATLKQLQFTPIGTKAAEYGASTWGNSATPPSGVDGYLRHVDGNENVDTAVRSYSMTRISVATGLPTFTQTYDVYGNGAGTSGRNAATLAADLDATGFDSYVVVKSYDEPQYNRLTSGLDTAMYRCGASPGVFGNTASFKSRAAYILIGRGGVGVGKGYEAYRGDADNDVNAYLKVAFQITQAGQLMVDGQAYSAGLVETGGIAAAAATEVLTPVTSSGVTVTEVLHIPDNLSFRTVLLSNTFTPSVDCTAEVTCSGNLSFTTSSNAGNYEGALQHGIYTGSGSGTLRADVNWYTPDVGSSKNYKSQMFVTTRLALTGGASVTFSWAAAKGNSGDTVAGQNLAMNVTLIKR